MVELTRLNGAKLVINSDLIEFIEASPDSLITLTTGKKIMVQETIAQIMQAVVHFRRLIRSSDSGVRPAVPTDTASTGVETTERE